MIGTITVRLVGLMLFGLTPSLVGCGGADVLSDEAYQLSTALYSTANRQASTGLDAVEREITAAESAGRITLAEANLLKDIVADAREGDWNAARDAAKAIMQQQIRAARSSASQERP